MIKDSNSIERRLLGLQKGRDSVMALSREMIRMSAKSITLMHARRRGEAARLLGRLKAMAARLKNIEKGHEFYALQANQEYAEACILYNILTGKGIPGIRRTGVGEAAYLLGVLDVVGELKREAYEELRHGNADKAGHYYETMVEIYDSLLHMRFANSILPDLRRKQDTARIQIEGTASALLSFRKSGA